jgi:hypothetical protein
MLHLEKENRGQVTITTHFLLLRIIPPTPAEGKVSGKGTMPMRNWSLTISQLAIFFEGRLDKALEL